MAVPLALQIGAQVAPFALRLFSGSQGAVDPQATLRMLIGEFNRALAPVSEGAARAGAITGAQLRQDVSSSVGRIGGGSAGTTRVTRGLSASASSSGAAAGRAAVAQSVAQLAQAALPSAISGQTQVKPPSGFQNLLAGLGGITAAEGNPFMGILNNIFKNSESGENPLDAGMLKQIFDRGLLNDSGQNFGTQGSELFFGAPPAGAGR